MIIGLSHSPGLCPENQGWAGSKVLRIKKPSETTILLCGLKRSPETSLLPLETRKQVAAPMFNILNFQTAFTSSVEQGMACWGP